MTRDHCKTEKRDQGLMFFPPLLSLINNARRLRLRRRVGIDQDWLNRGTMVILLVGLLIPTNYHRPPIQPSSGKSDGRPRIVGARSAPFDIANAPKRTLRAAARRQIVFKGGSNASCKADNDRERLRITSETPFSIQMGCTHYINYTCG